MAKFSVKVLLSITSGYAKLIGIKKSNTGRIVEIVNKDSSSHNDILLESVLV